MHHALMAQCAVFVGMHVRVWNVGGRGRVASSSWVRSSWTILVKEPEQGIRTLQGIVPETSTPEIDEALEPFTVLRTRDWD